MRRITEDDAGWVGLITLLIVLTILGIIMSGCGPQKNPGPERRCVVAHDESQLSTVPNMGGPSMPIGSGLHLAIVTVCDTSALFHPVDPWGDGREIPHSRRKGD